MLATALSLPLLALLAEPAPVVSPATTDEHGCLVHQVESPYQAGKTLIRVLLPEERQPGQKYPVVFVLPVEAQQENRYGDGLVEIKKHDLHNKQRVIFVAPTFSHLPWYADHPSDRALRQETYFLKVVVPVVEQNYPARDQPEGRLLLGFSKSGWGAWSLLLRHSEVFGRAAAWDAPLMMDRVGLYGTTPIFGDQDNFERYRIADLLRRSADKLRDKRLILTGYGNFREHHQQTHKLLGELQIPHDDRDGPQRTHDWHSGWVTEAVELLLQGSEPP